MTGIFKVLLLVIALCGFSTTPPRVSVSLAPASGAFSLHEPVRLTMSIENHGLEPLTLDLGKNFEDNLRVEVTGPDGLGRASVAAASAGGIYIPGSVTIKPGASRRSVLLLNRWFEFEEVGEYKVSLKIEPGSAANQTVPGASTVVRVVPRDPARLSEVCEQLASEAVSPIAERAVEAARALSFAADEACLASMSKVLTKGRHGRPQAVAGLARLGSEKAIGQLVQFWDRLGAHEKARAWAVISDTRRPALKKALESAGKKVESDDPWSLGEPNPPMKD